ncbi:hypothetical protein SeLEV6574_g08094, partial [Synchytrium endobioticum]
FLQQDARSFMLEGEQMAVKYDVPVANKIKDRMRVIANHLQHHLTQAQEWYKKNADRHRTTEVEFKVGEEVLVSTKNVRTQRPTKKLEMTWMGPYRIRRKLSNVTYEVALPKNIRIHPVFHIKLLKPYKRSEEPRLGNAKPPPIAVDPEEGYIIMDIVDVRRRGRGFEYLIQWEGYGNDEQTWEPRKSLNDDVMLRIWHANNPSKPSPFSEARQEGGGGDNVTDWTS